MELGAPASYLTLRAGAAVLSADGAHIGTVEHVLADPDVDVFDGLVIDGPRFVDAPEVAEIYERGVVLALSADAARALPAPAPNPATLTADPGDTAPDDLGDKLHRAWRLISGDY